MASVAVFGSEFGCTDAQKQVDVVLFCVTSKLVNTEDSIGLFQILVSGPRQCQTCVRAPDVRPARSIRAVCVLLRVWRAKWVLPVPLRCCDTYTLFCLHA